MIAELVQYRELLYALTWKEIRVRYKQSLMGFLWAILMPLLIVVAGVVVKQAFAVASGRGLDTKDLLSVSVKALPWAFFVGAVRFGTNSLVSNTNLVAKIYFPREVLPISAVMAALFDFAIAAVAFGFFLAVAGPGLSVYLAWTPLLLVILVMFSTALALLLSCANLFFRDIKYLVEVVLTFGIFFTPVFYEARMLGKWAPLILLNPISPVLEGLNDTIVLRQAPALTWVAYAGGATLVLFLFASWVFERAEGVFAERI